MKLILGKSIKSKKDVHENLFDRGGTVYLGVNRPG
jgi:hypothetical protein